MADDSWRSEAIAWALGLGEIARAARDGDTSASYRLTDEFAAGSVRFLAREPEGVARRDFDEFARLVKSALHEPTKYRDAGDAIQVFAECIAALEEWARSAALEVPKSTIIH